MISIELAAVCVWWSRDPSDHHLSLMPRPTHALTLRCTVLFCVTLCYVALCTLFSVLTLYCTFLYLYTICKTVKCTAVFCIELLWRLFCCHHSLRWQGFVQCTVDVVCTVWEQGLISGAQCKVDETQVLSLNRATWPDHLVSDQTVVILKQKQKQNFKNAKTHPGFCVGLEWVICISFTAASRLKKYSVMVNDHW